MKTMLQTIAKHFWVLALISLTAFMPQNAYALTAAVQQVQGEVMVHKAAAAVDAWDKISADTTLENGDSVKTGKGTCALVYSDQATFTVEENTSLTVEEKPTAQDITLLLGKIRGKVNKQRAEQPFQVITPAAVASVRGTEVDFAFNEAGELVVDLHNGKIQVLNADAEMTLDLEGKKSITVKYDKEANIIRVKNECASDGPVSFTVLGAEYSENPCDLKEVTLATAEQGLKIPDDDDDDDDDDREPVDEVVR